MSHHEHSEEDIELEDLAHSDDEMDTGALGIERVEVKPPVTPSYVPGSPNRVVASKQDANDADEMNQIDPNFGSTSRLPNSFYTHTISHHEDLDRGVDDTDTHVDLEASSSAGQTETGDDAPASTSSGSRAIARRVIAMILSAAIFVLSVLLIFVTVSLASEFSDSENDYNLYWGTELAAYAIVTMGFIASLATFGAHWTHPSLGVVGSIPFWIVSFFVFCFALALDDRSNPVMFVICTIILVEMVTAICFCFICAVKDLRPLHCCSCGSCNQNTVEADT